jgi:hypothetical protein
MYGDPMGTVAKMMSEVKERLAKVDSGKETQATEKSIVAMLNELIQIDEDKNSPPGAPQPNTRPNGQPQPGPPGPDGRPVPVPPRLPNGRRPPKVPTTPRFRSTLTIGDAAHQPQTAATGARQPSNIEPSLPPEQVETLIEICRMRVNGRYRDVIIDYHRALAEAGTNR